MASSLSPCSGAWALLVSMVACLVAGAAQQASRVAPGRLQPTHLAAHRSRGQSHQRRRRRAGRSAGLLRRLGVRRHRQDDRRRHHVGADLRRPAGALDRRHRRRAVRSQHRVGRHRRERASAATSRSAKGSSSPPMPGRTWARMGLEQDRPHRASDRASAESGRRARVRARPRLRAAARARRLPHDRRRQELGPRAVRRREHRLLGAGDGSAEPAQAVRRHVADRDQDVGPRERRARAAACSRRTTAARRGRGCAAAACPTRDVGKVKVAIAPSNPDRVYAHDRNRRRHSVERARRPIAARCGGRTTAARTGGSSATTATPWAASHYYSHIFVAPDNENETYFLTAGYSVSLDGGETLVQQPGTARTRRRPPRHVDRSDEREPHDRRPRPGLLDLAQPRPHAGIAIGCRTRRCTTSRSTTQIPYNVSATSRTAVVSRAEQQSRIRRRTIPRSMWHTVAGGESGWATPDPVDPNLIWSSASGSGSVGGIVAIYEENRRQARNVEVWPEQANGVPAELRYRFNWTMPLTMSPHDRNTVYVGSQHVHRTTQPRAELGGDQPRSDHQRQGAPAVLRRAHRRQHRRRVRVRRHGDRRVAAGDAA